MTNRARLIEVAAEMFYGEGYAAISVENLLVRTGVARSNFYYHFKGKLELAREVVKYWIKAYDRDLVEPALGDRLLAPAEQLRRLFALADGTQDAAAGHTGCPLGSLAVELAQHDEEIRTVLSDYFTSLRGRIEQTIADGIVRGEFMAVVPAAEGAALAVSMLEGALLLNRTHQRPGQIRRAGLSFVALLQGDRAAHRHDIQQQ